MTLGVAGEIVQYMCLRARVSDGQPRRFPCDTAAGSKTHRAFGLFEPPERPDPAHGSSAEDPKIAYKMPGCPPQS